MNDPANLAYYTQLVELRANSSLAMRHFVSPSKSQQRTLQSLAHAMGLDYEYSRVTRTVTITKEFPNNQPGVAGGRGLRFIHQHLEGITDDSSKILITTDPNETLLNYEIQIANPSLNLCDESSNNKLNLTLTDLDYSSGFSDGFDVSQSPAPIRPRRTALPSAVISNQEHLAEPNEYFQPTLGCINPWSPTIFNSWELGQPDNPSVGPIDNAQRLFSEYSIDSNPFEGNWNEDYYADFGHGFESVNSLHKPYRCKFHSCKNARFFSSTALRLHEREAHAMHRYRKHKFPCTFDGCERGVPGNGFLEQTSLCRHIMRVHRPLPSPARGSRKLLKKRKDSYAATGASRQSPSSMVSNSSSGYQEIIFDSKSDHSSGQESACSRQSGRSGPLGKVAVAAMRLVKAVGACWKCKFLRKQVSINAQSMNYVNHITV